MRKYLLTALFGMAIGIGSGNAEEVIIRTRPPHAVVETRACVPAALMSGSVDITAGTETLTHGLRDIGRPRHTPTHAGSPPGTSTGRAVMFSLMADGDSLQAFRSLR